jgi:hypothetical protein
MLVKDLHFFNAKATSVVFNLYAIGPSLTPIVELFTVTLATATSVAYTWSLVLGEGDSLQVNTDSGPLHIWVSGSLLYGVATGYTPPASPSVLPALPPLLDRAAAPTVLAE